MSKPPRALGPFDPAPPGPKPDGTTTGASKAPTVRYVRLRTFYMRSDLGPLESWRTLWTQHEQFLGSEGKSRGERPTPANGVLRTALRVKRTLALSLGYLRARRAAHRRLKDVLELPVRGELALVRRSGAVKVLDTERERVVTLVRGAEHEARLRARLDDARHVARLPYAPRVLEESLDQGWFAEEFVAGSHPVGFSGCLDGFDDVYLPLLVAFLRAEETRSVPLRDYATALAEQILDPDGLLARLPAEGREAVRAFVGDVRARLARAGDVRLPLTFSHGDFFSGNVVVTPAGAPRAIDWANRGQRSPLHDLYYLLMNHCVRVLDPDERQERLREMLEALRLRLEGEDPERFALLESALTDAPEFRWLFYLECVQVPLVRCDDPADRYVSAMLNRVARFVEHERAVGGTLGGEATSR